MTAARPTKDGLTKRLRAEERRSKRLAHAAELLKEELASVKADNASLREQIQRFDDANPFDVRPHQ